MSAVETLREAARLMRERAEAATQEARWTVDVNGMRRNTTVVKSGEAFLAHYLDDADAQHIAGADPTTMLAVAKLLRDHADTWVPFRGEEQSPCEEHSCVHADCEEFYRLLPLARTYLRSAS